MILGARLPKFGLLHSSLNKSTESALAHRFRTPVNPIVFISLDWTDPVRFTCAIFRDESPPNQPARSCGPPRRFSPATSPIQPRSITAVPNIVSPDCLQHYFTAPNLLCPHNTPRESSAERGTSTSSTDPCLSRVMLLNYQGSTTRIRQICPRALCPHHTRNSEHVSLSYACERTPFLFPHEMPRRIHPERNLRLRSTYKSTPLHPSAISVSHFSSSSRSVSAPLLPAQISPSLKHPRVESLSLPTEGCTLFSPESTGPPGDKRRRNSSGSDAVTQFPAGEPLLPACSA